MNYHLIKVPEWNQSISNKIWRRKNRICDILTIRSSYSFNPHVRTYFWATISYKYHDSNLNTQIPGIGGAEIHSLWDDFT